ncbi:MAG: hypothetical protein D8B42_03200 [Kingella sp. (in: b-proteobacteria)]|nr:MAG: hypothetical protein D8B42_03200 [Kingella sp. (in: b-proteobacteria)]
MRRAALCPDLPPASRAGCRRFSPLRLRPNPPRGSNTAPCPPRLPYAKTARRRHRRPSPTLAADSGQRDIRGLILGSVDIQLLKRILRQKMADARRKREPMPSIGECFQRGRCRFMA